MMRTVCWLPAAHVVPAHPTMDLLGRPIPFDRTRYDRFQELLRRYGDSAAVAAKSDLIRAVLAGDSPPPDTSALPRTTRRAATLALRQLGYLNPDPALLRRWATALDRPLRRLRGSDHRLDAGISSARSLAIEGPYQVRPRSGSSATAPFSKASLPPNSAAACWPPSAGPAGVRLVWPISSGHSGIVLVQPLNQGGCRKREPGANPGLPRSGKRERPPP
jgi:hypothetical protein